MKVLVTGASGFVGRALCEHLHKLSYLVVPIVRRPCNLLNAVVVPEDSIDDWAKVIMGCHSFVHLAGRAHIMPESDCNPLIAFRKVNTEFTLFVARQCAAAGVRRFVYISSIGVNGNVTNGTPFTEFSLPNPHNEYAISKYEAEFGLKAIEQETGMEVVIIRPPLVYGPGAKGSFTKMLSWALKGVPLPLGGIHNCRSFIALDNLVDFIALCVDIERSPLAKNQVFLIADGEDVSTSEFLRRIAISYNRKSYLIPIPVGFLRFGAWIFGKKDIADRLFGSLVVDASKAREMLGWYPPVEMNQQLRKMSRAPLL